MGRRSLSVAEATPDAINAQLALVDGITQLLSLTGQLSDDALSDNVQMTEVIGPSRQLAMEAMGLQAKGRVITYRVPGSTLAETYLAVNAKLQSDGATWIRDDSAQQALILRLSMNSGGLDFYRAPSGTGTITWTNIFSITSTGIIQVGTWQSTKIGLAYGGTNADLSGTGGSNQVLQQTSAGAAITVGTIDAAAIGSGTLALARGGTNANLSATGGANQFVKQSSSGAAFTVGALGAGDVPDAALTSNVPLKNASNTYTGTPQTFTCAATFTKNDNTITGNTDNLNIGSAVFIRLTGTPAAFNLTGFANGAAGRLIIVENITGVNCTFKNNTTSSAGNKLITKNGADYVLANGNCAMWIYDSDQAFWMQVCG